MLEPWALFGITVLIALTSSQRLFYYYYLMTECLSAKNTEQEERLGHLCAEKVSKKKHWRNERAGIDGFR